MRELPLFTATEHVNTLTPTQDGKLWAVLHNLGKSALAQVCEGGGGGAPRGMRAWWGGGGGAQRCMRSW